LDLHKVPAKIEVLSDAFRLLKRQPPAFGDISCIAEEIDLSNNDDLLVESKPFPRCKNGDPLMKRWRCIVCGYIHDGAKPPYRCPVCGAPATLFELLPSSDAT
jgi:rubredoxin